jgi:SAM-dependent methyltransferase
MMNLGRLTTLVQRYGVGGLGRRALARAAAAVRFREDAVYGQDEELAMHRHLLVGTVLNAGCGWKDIRPYVTGTVVNQDLSWPGDTRTLDLTGPLHQLQAADDAFDAIVCQAVLEHVENPEECVAELFRVLKPGGHALVSVPFLQPEHKAPGDFQRYTKDGLALLFTRHGFTVLQTRALFSVYHTLYWQVWIWLHLKTTVGSVLLRYLLLPPLWWGAKRNRLQSDRLAAGFQVIARKPARGQ